jgi:glycosyltransferase involved in cell wall biosynthesis
VGPGSHGLPGIGSKTGVPVVEIRIPTFNRPGLLRRALESLLAQSHSNWRAIILDDGNIEPTRALLDDLHEPRIVHRPNERHLGAAGNIGQSFSGIPYVGGTHFAVLEDDNFWYPAFLARTVEIMSRHDVSIVQSNQWIEEVVTDGEPGTVLSATALGDCHAEGRWSADQFKIPMLWRLPISNSGLCWRLGARSDLRADDILDPVLQEWVRAYRIVDPVYFLSDPIGVWRANGTESKRSMGESKRDAWRHFLHRERAVQMMRRQVYASAGNEAGLSGILSDRFPTPIGAREEGVRKALLAWPAKSQLTLSRRSEILAKASLLWLSSRPLWSPGLAAI